MIYFIRQPVKYPKGGIMNKFLRISVLLLLSLMLFPAIYAEKSEEEVAVENAIKNLESGNWYLRANAMQFLQTAKDNSALKKVFPKALDSSNPFVKMVACEVAANLDLKDQTMKIAETCINTSHRAVVDSAAMALVKLGEAEGFKALSEVWRERSGNYGLNFARSLRFFVALNPVSEITKILRGNFDEFTKCYALEAAIELGKPERNIDKAISSLKPKTEMLEYLICKYMPCFSDAKAAEKNLKKLLKSRSVNIAMCAGTALSKLKSFDGGTITSIAAKKASAGPSNAALKAIGDNSSIKDYKFLGKLFSSKTDADKIAACTFVEGFQIAAMIPTMKKLFK